ncbi:MAG: PGF-pre-PGF domain-containing protein [Methanomethylovorans sp.]|uniref:PGF-pre-PGF domain-containing protein n=1 Tax=Methanomethylovorans sp. TaxID=2758717 RepID=UPI003C73D24B
MQIKSNKLACIGFVLFLFLMTTGVSSADVDIGDIENKLITENEHLTFDVTAKDEQNINVTITLDVRNLPEGATFTQSPNDPNTYTFSWTPGPGAALSSPYHVTFIATTSDGSDDDEDVRIDVRGVDKNTLLNTILSATRKIASVVPGNEVGQYPQSDIDAFQTAIDTAQGVADDPNATNAEVSQAVTDLKAAEAIFDAARITSIDKSALTAAITAANTKVTTASPGTGIGQYPQASIDAFRIAIDTARRVADDPNATNAEVSQAVTDLKAAEDTFDASRQMPPASVTNLRETATGTNWVHWTWSNPHDADFAHVRVYIDGVFVTTTPANHYNATGFPEGTVHTIGIQTVDTAGNINPTMVTDQATTRTRDTTPPASVTGLRETSTGTNWVHWIWSNPPDADFGHVRIYIDGAFVTTTPSNHYNATGFLEGTVHTIGIQTVDTAGNINTTWVNDSATTSSSSSSGSSGGSSSKKSSSSSGGGGGADSVEDFANVALKDVAKRYLRMNAYVTYEFSRPGNDIQSISFYSLKNSGEITSTIEVLNGRSKLVPMNPEGLLYKYVNIWVGKAGFATPANIGNAQVRFIVSNSWMKEMAISADDISLQRYNGNAWEILPTTLEGNNTGYSIFKAQTPGFSPFAITAGKKFAASIDGTGENNTNIEDIALENTKTGKSRIWTYIIVLVLMGILAVGYEYLKKE